jgi:hypothetical protein
MSVNAALSFAGRNPLPFSETDTYTAISGVLAFATTMYSWWKNQNVTPAAIQGATLTKAIKSNATTQATSLPPQITAPLETSDVEVEQATTTDLDAAFARATNETKDA